MKKRLGLIFTVIICLGATARAQTKPFPVEKIDSLMQIQKKPIVILLSTDWCKYCHLQKKQMGENKELSKRSDEFYYVIFNAEFDDTVMFNRQRFRQKTNAFSGGAHELAIALNGSEKLAFPTWVILDKDYQIIFHHSGILPPKQLNKVLELLKS